MDAISATPSSRSSASWCRCATAPTAAAGAGQHPVRLAGESGARRRPGARSPRRLSRARRRPASRRQHPLPSRHGAASPGAQRRGARHRGDGAARPQAGRRRGGGVGGAARQSPRLHLPRRRARNRRGGGAQRGNSPRPRRRERRPEPRLRPDGEAAAGWRRVDHAGRHPDLRARRGARGGEEHRRRAARRADGAQPARPGHHGGAAGAADALVADGAAGGDRRRGGAPAAACRGPRARRHAGALGGTRIDLLRRPLHPFRAAVARAGAAASGSAEGALRGAAAGRRIAHRRRCRPASRRDRGGGARAAGGGGVRSHRRRRLPGCPRRSLLAARSRPARPRRPPRAFDLRRGDAPPPAGPGRGRLAHHPHARAQHPGVGRLRGRPGDLRRGGAGQGAAARLQPVPRRRGDAGNERLRVRRHHARRSGAERHAGHPGDLAGSRRGSPPRSRSRRARLHRQERVRPGTAAGDDTRADRLTSQIRFPNCSGNRSRKNFQPS